MGKLTLIAIIVLGSVVSFTATEANGQSWLDKMKDAGKKVSKHRKRHGMPLLNLVKKLGKTRRTGVVLRGISRQSGSKKVKVR